MMQWETPPDYENQHEPHPTEEFTQSANTSITEDATRENDAELEAPLSAFDGGEALVPVRDTKEWVGRSKYVREQENMERKGHIRRQRLYAVPSRIS
jgi:hypothetical protein